MSKADVSTTPIRSRRAVLATIAAAGGAMAIPAAASTMGQDAELIALGKKLDPLVDAYYVARQPWAQALTQRNREVEERFGSPADRGYRETDEIRAGREEIEERLRLQSASDNLSAAYEKVEAIAKVIEALPCKSIEGLRAKALVAFWEVAPSGAGDTQFSFEDAYPFERLFCAVAELCGLDGKVAATGFDTLLGLSSAEEDDRNDRSQTMPETESR